MRLTAKKIIRQFPFLFGGKRPSFVQLLEDAIVDADGNGDYLTISAAVAAGAKTMYVLRAEQDAAVSESTAGLRIETAPGSNFSHADGITLTGANSTLVLGPGTSVTGAVVMTGDDPTLIMENNATVKKVDLGLNGFADGGGYASQCTETAGSSYGFTLNGTDSIVRDIYINISGSATKGVNDIASNPTRQNLVNIKVSAWAVSFNYTKDESLIFGCSEETTRNKTFIANAFDKLRILCNNARGMTSSGDGVGLAGGIDYVTSGNIFEAGDISITADDDNVVYGNRINEAVTDHSGGTAVVAKNDVGAF